MPTMRDYLNLLEAQVFPLAGENRHGKFDTTVLADPSPFSIKPFMKRTRTEQLRGTAAEGHVYLWPATEATHLMVRTASGFGPTGGADFWIVVEDVDPLSPDWERFDDDPIRDGLRLLPGKYGRTES